MALFIILSLKLQTFLMTILVATGFQSALDVLPAAQ